MIKRILHLMFLIILVQTTLKAQSKIITGKVLTKEGEALIGASVIIAGTTIGTTTDVDGNFKLNVNETQLN